jgi:outer membrane protein assembly factor BamB
MKSVSLLTLIFLLFSCSSSKEQTVYEFRGTDRTGIYNETSLLEVWPEEGPEELWSIDSLGNGYGSPVFTENHFFITGEIDSMAVLYCFEIDGSKVWQITLGSEWMKSYPGGRDAPTIVGDRIYIGTGLGNLYCLKRSNGKVLWSKQLKEDFGGRLPLHGYSEAPLIDGDMVFWTPAARQTMLLRSTGLPVILYGRTPVSVRLWAIIRRA